MFIHSAGLVLVPAGLQLLLLPITPESPRYLLLYKNSRDKAEEGKLGSFNNDRFLSRISVVQFFIFFSVLIWLRGNTDVQKDIQEMVHEQQVAKTLPKVRHSLTYQTTPTDPYSLLKYFISRIPHKNFQLLL